ncbi:hypothetical protein NP493_246g02075 [Ridgeia piscesae]|uniref:Mutator-like transposase domain-containing protein n=1 Tax=Ridgeia piscesae TaxID=27915 RepID=A0AAD9NYZ6_RIDPI|nr:hypothetical protein NP493_246g02075 [Ridgeia piscesae]
MLKRGHTSAYGIGCVIDTETGLVLDLAVLSSYCQACSCAEARCGGQDTAQFQTWLAHHTDCNGTTMAHLDLVAWSTMVSDGDSRTFKRLTEMKVYGDDVKITKEECINHVAKRMGTALRKLATQTKKTGVTLGGHGDGKLTKGTIKQLTIYYNNAIRANHDNLDGMVNAVMASFYHVSFFQKALAVGKQPGDHKTNMTHRLSPEVAAHIKDVYVRLSDHDLLSHCLRSVTQNPNESLHAKIWAKCPPRLAS